MDTSLYSVTKIRELLAKYNLAPLKSLGQNFLLDQNIVAKIAEAAVEENEYVLEIGPGMGALTLSLAARAKKVVAIEIDKGMMSVLQETLAEQKNVEIIHADFLALDLAEIQQKYFNGEAFAVAGNLPYYITSKCIMKVLETENIELKRFTAMVQKEVAERLSAMPGEKAYGALTASVAYYGKIETLFDVEKNCFYPAPDVASAIVQLTPARYEGVGREAYAKVVRTLFAMRRKTVLNNLKAGFSLSSEAAMCALGKASIAPNARAETLDISDFAALANVLEKEN